MLRIFGRTTLEIQFIAYSLLHLAPVNRHPEVRAQRASKGDGPSASAASFEGRFAATSG
jgi:hypothetical protein